MESDKNRQRAHGALSFPHGVLLLIFVSLLGTVYSRYFAETHFVTLELISDTSRMI